jgi:CDP-paratose 2-epimerase
MDSVAIEEGSTRYGYRDLQYGVGEEQPLDFHSPYGCSKGAADQYVRDYARIYGLQTVVLRQSCIYGQRQFGVEDQGWAAHFVIRGTLGEQVTVYGDGKQVRDMLHVDDLVRLYLRVVESISDVGGEVFNVGGGIANTLSVWAEFRPLLENLLGKPFAVAHSGWRPGDQRIYVSDIRKAARVLDWKPRIGVEEGLASLVQWVQEQAPRLAENRLPSGLSR